MLTSTGVEPLFIWSMTRKVRDMRKKTIPSKLTSLRIRGDLAQRLAEMNLADGERSKLYNRGIELALKERNRKNKQGADTLTQSA
jgi:hypothetical protein